MHIPQCSIWTLCTLKLIQENNFLQRCVYCPKCYRPLRQFSCLPAPIINQCQNSVAKFCVPMSPYAILYSILGINKEIKSRNKETKKLVIKSEVHLGKKICILKTAESWGTSLKQFLWAVTMQGSLFLTSQVLLADSP